MIVSNKRSRFTHSRTRPSRRTTRSSLFSSELLAIFLGVFTLGTQTVDAAYITSIFYVSPNLKVNAGDLRFNPSDSASYSPSTYPELSMGRIVDGSKANLRVVIRKLSSESPSSVQVQLERDMNGYFQFETSQSVQMASGSVAVVDFAIQNPSTMNGGWTYQNGTPGAYNVWAVKLGSPDTPTRHQAAIGYPDEGANGDFDVYQIGQTFNTFTSTSNWAFDGLVGHPSFPNQAVSTFNSANGYVGAKGSRSTLCDPLNDSLGLWYTDNYWSSSFDSWNENAVITLGTFSSPHTTTSTLPSFRLRSFIQGDGHASLLVPQSLGDNDFSSVASPKTFAVLGSYSQIVPSANSRLGHAFDYWVWDDCDQPNAEIRMHDIESKHFSLNRALQQWIEDSLPSGLSPFASYTQNGFTSWVASGMGNYSAHISGGLPVFGGTGGLPGSGLNYASFGAPNLNRPLVAGALYLAQVGVSRNSLDSATQKVPDLRLIFHSGDWDIVAPTVLTDSSNSTSESYRDFSPRRLTATTGPRFYYALFYVPTHVSTGGSSDKIGFFVDYVQTAGDYTTFNLHSVKLWELDPTGLGLP